MIYYQFWRLSGSSRRCEEEFSSQCLFVISIAGNEMPCLGPCGANLPIMCFTSVSGFSFPSHMERAILFHGFRHDFRLIQLSVFRLYSLKFVLTYFSRCSY